VGKIVQIRSIRPIRVIRVIRVQNNPAFAHHALRQPILNSQLREAPETYQSTRSEAG